MDQGEAHISKKGAGDLWGKKLTFLWLQGLVNSFAIFLRKSVVKFLSVIEESVWRSEAQFRFSIN